MLNQRLVSWQSSGHKVLYTPQYHCDLQPIKTSGHKSQVKLGGQYDTSIAMQIVKYHLEAHFNASIQTQQGELRSYILM